MNASLKKSLCFAAALAASAVFSSRAEEAPVAAPAAPEPAEAAPERPQVRPGPLPRGREMPPEMRAYVDRLEAIRLARDEQARAAAQAAKDIEERKTALAAENEDVKAAVDKVAELRDALSAAEKTLSEFYAKDEALAALETKKADAEKARDDKQREMNSAVAAAMDERAARFRTPRPAPGAPGAPAVRPSVPAPAPAPAPVPAAKAPAE